MEDGLGQFLRATRKRAGITQQELAQNVYRSVAWVRRLEHGESATITAIDADKLAEVLTFRPWEVRYLNIMLGIDRRGEPMDDTAMIAYVDGLAPHPAAWVSADGASHYNEPMRELFPSVGKVRFIGEWFFSPPAKEAILNWDEVVDVLMADARFRIAMDDHDHFMVEVMDQLMDAYPEVKERWDANPIPVDPDPLPWEVARPDGTVVRVAMRAWWQAHRRGLLMQGVMQG